MLPEIELSPVVMPLEGLRSRRCRVQLRREWSPYGILLLNIDRWPVTCCQRLDRHGRHLEGFQADAAECSLG
jgi:hypothetical protein